LYVIGTKPARKCSHRQSASRTCRSSGRSGVFTIFRFISG
jgi:hypothetical protein